KLRCSSGSVRSAPEFDQKIGRNKAQFPEEEPVNKIERGERAEESGLQEQHERNKRALVIDIAIGRKQCERDHKSGQRNHEQSQAVDSQEILDFDGWNP